MKRLMLILSTLIILVSCDHTPQEKAEATIKKWMQKNLKDPSSYESVSFSKLDSTNISVRQKKLITETYPELIKTYSENAATDSLYVALDLKNIERNKKDGLYKGEYKEYLDVSISERQKSFKSNKASLERVIREKDSISNNKEFYAYVISHRYRAKNSFGALDFGEVRFYLDTDLKYIIDTETIK